MKLYNQLKSEIIKNWQEMKKDRSLMLKNLSKALFLFSAISFIFNFGYFIFFLFSGLAINEKAKKFIIEKLNKKNFSNKKYIGIMLSIAFLGFIFSGDSDDVNKNVTKEKATASSSAKKQKTTDEKREAKEQVKEAEEKLLAKKVETRELLKLTEHISKGGSYAFIEISDLDSKLFSGKNCSQVLGLRASLKPVQGSHPFGFVVNGTNGEVAEILTKFTFGDNAPIYKMPNSCNIFSSPDQVELSCGLDDPKYLDEIYERDKGTNIVTKFGSLKRLYETPQVPDWEVLSSSNGKTLTSAVVRLQKDSIFMNKPWKINRRAYICRN